MRRARRQLRAVQQRQPWTADDASALRDGVIDVLMLRRQLFFFGDGCDACHSSSIYQASFSLSHLVTMSTTSSFDCPFLRPIWPAPGIIRNSFGLPCSASK